MAKSETPPGPSDQQNSPDSPNIRYDDFIRRIKPKPDSNEQVVLLQGYIGESATEDKIRLYGDASLATFVDIAIADVLFSIPNENDALGGSRIWVKQNANTQYNEGSPYAQGNMYNDYMQNQYDPGIQNFGPAPATAPPQCLQPQSAFVICPTRQLNCSTVPPYCIVLNTVACPTRFIFNCQTINIKQCVTPRGVWTICRPCNITPQTLPFAGGAANPAAPVAGAAATDDPYGSYGNYASGDMYNDYMQNQYDPGLQNFGPAPITAPPQCLQVQTAFLACPTRQLNCSTAPPYCVVLNTVACPTRFIFNCQTIIKQCVTPRGIWTICRPCNITPQTLPFAAGAANPGAPVAGAAATDDPYGSYGNYAGGDMYNDYMQNQYDPGFQNFGPAPITAPPQCLQVQTAFLACPTRQLNCSTAPPYCIQVNTLACPSRALFNCLTRNIIQCVTPRGVWTICRPCNITPQTLPIGPGTINPGGPIAGGGGFMNDPYGAYGNFNTGYDPYGY